MAACLSITQAIDWVHERTFFAAGLRPASALLADGSTVSLFVPRRPDPRRPALVLLHGFGARAVWQWSPYLRSLLNAGFDLYVPDLLFFGHSYTPSPDRTEAFQAKAVVEAMAANGIRRFGVVGVSYGGFVAYKMAELYPQTVEKVVICCGGVTVEEKDLEEGLLVVRNLEEAADILLPQRPEKLRELVRLSFVRPPAVMPSCFLRDYIQMMCTNHAQEKVDLLRAIIKDRKLSNLPKIQQRTLIVWGDQDRVFPMELAYRLKSHLGDNAKLAVIKKAGHAVNLEKPREFSRHIRAFFLEAPPVLDLIGPHLRSCVKEDATSENGLLENMS